MFNHRWNPDTGVFEYVPHERVFVFPPGEAGESMVQEQFAADADINAILRKYVTHGVPPNLVNSPGAFGDFTGDNDYFSVHLKVIGAQQAFMTLPAEVRAYFDNDPGKLLDCLHNPARKDELIKLGLVNPDIVPAPPKADAPADPS